MSAEDWAGAPCGLVTLDHEGTVVAANTTLLSWTGRVAEDVVGRVRFAGLLTAGGGIYWETHLAPRLALEGALSEVAVELRGPGGRVPVLLAAAVVPGSDRVRVSVHSARERMRFEGDLRLARERAQQLASRLGTLQSVTAGLSRALGLQGVADALVAAGTGPLHAPSASVWTSVDGGLRLQSAAGAGSPSPVPSLARAGDPTPWTADGHLHLPLPGTADLQGVLSLAQPTGGPAPELDVLTAVAQQAGLALDRARLHEQSAGVAHALQHAMLTVDLPVDPRYRTEATYRAGVELLEVGGDWYDVFLVGPGTLGVVVGDVVGRGLAAAGAMGQLRSAVRAVAEPGAGPAAVLGRLDRFVDQVPSARVATVAYAELDLADGTLRYACAGHPPPLLLPGDGAHEFLWGGRSTPLGVVLDGVPRPEAEVRLAVGDRVLLYTDGLVERRDRGLDEGMAALAQAVGDVGDPSSTGTVDAVTAAMLHGEESSDDVCALLLTWAGEGRPAR